MKKIAALLMGIVISATVPTLAQPLTPSAKVTPLLKEAQALVSASKYKAATAKLDEAEAVKSTRDDDAAINAMRQFIDHEIAVQAQVKP